ncbi:MAG: sigma-54 dependent transcriptional regulator [bacterium]
MSSKKPLVVLSRRPALYKEVADWQLPEVELYLYDSPSEALAEVAAGQSVMLLFDTSEYTRHRHVIRKFFSLRGDSDLVVLGDQGILSDWEEQSRIGSSRLLPVDVTAAELRGVIQRLLLLREVRQRSGIVGRSRAVSEMISLIAQAAPIHVNILILGESGTGKELVARAIHAHSSRATGPFLSVNCGAMSEGVLESELFGHARGAFTGAVAAHDGVFKRADGGTLFLDEVAEMPLGMQTRFLRSLETGEFNPVGGRQTLRSDIRFVAATHRDLALEVEEGRFRQDLYYRLRVIVIPTPPLRDRPSDIPVLTETFIKLENQEHGLSVRGISRPALERMTEFSWPGNIRELRNVIRAAAVLKQSGMIELADLPAEIRFAGTPALGSKLPVPVQRDRESLERELMMATLLELRTDIKAIKAALLGTMPGATGQAIPYGEQVVETYSGATGYSPVAFSEGGDLQTAERALIEAALKATGGRRRQAAARLGISERTLYRKIKRYEL